MMDANNIFSKLLAETRPGDMFGKIWGCGLISCSRLNYWIGELAIKLTGRFILEPFSGLPKM